jgi:uncharacterized iron-regulated protein
MASGRGLKDFSLTVLAFIGCTALCISSCASSAWESTFGRNHPLAGRIWDVAARQFIDYDSLIAHLSHADFVLLGERHDNPDHHRLQASVLRGVIAAGRRPAVGFEMLDIDDAPAIARHLAAAPNDATGLGRALNWNQRGWPDWTMYEPIAAAALAAKLPIVATNLPQATVAKMRTGGLAALEPRLIHDLGLDRPLPAPLFTRMAADIRESHCGYLPEQSIKTMVDIQRARDARMALSLMAAASADGAVLIAGAGHVRKDYAIPVYLAANPGGKSIASVAFVELANQKMAPQDYAPQSNDHLPFDYVWFTPRIDDEDPCEKFKSQLERLKKAQ